MADTTQQTLAELSGQGQLPRAFPLPTISEDTLHYALHLPSSSYSKTTADPADITTETGALALATLITTYVDSLLVQPWLWNKDGWELKLVRPETRPAAGKGRAAAEGDESTLEGTMRVGDAVDDEWLVVWILRKVSERWPELVISIRDSDGEFMLIEAADVLPPWLSPENAENRLWIKGGHLHLLPLSVKSSPSAVAMRPKQIRDDDYDEYGRAFDPDAWVSEADAVEAVRTGSKKYRAPEVERAVWARVDCYPEALITHQHKTLAYLPVGVAKALAVQPDLIQRAVESFYVRDPAQLRAAARMSHFPPYPAILSPVVMTRAAYAQLQGQIFHPPRVFGPEWHVRDADEEEGDEASKGGVKDEEKTKREKERRWRDLGVKIATGFEIMYREGGRKGRAADTEGDVQEYGTDPEYQQYMATLKRAGFFGSELEGSEKWKVKEIEALQGWRAVRSSDTTQERASFAYLVDKAIAAAPDTAGTSVSSDALEDDNSWLEVSPVELDGMMMRITGQQREQAGQGSGVQGGAEADGSAELGEEHGKALQELADKVKEFVGGQGDFQGARFADELSDDDEDDEDEEQPMTAAERERRLAELVPGLSAEEWGRKPEVKDVAMAESSGLSDEKTATTEQANEARGSKSILINGETPLTNTLLPAKMRPPVFEKQHFDGVETDSEDENEGEEGLPPPGTIGRRIATMKWGEGVENSARIEEVDEEMEAGGGKVGKRRVAFEKGMGRKEKVGKDGKGEMEETEGMDEDEKEEEEEEKRRKMLQLDLDGIDEEMRRRVWGGDSGSGKGQGAAGGEDVLGHGMEEVEDVDEEDEGDEGEEGDLEKMDVDDIYEQEEFLKFSREALGINEEMWEGILKSRKERGAFVPESKGSGAQSSKAKDKLPKSKSQGQSATPKGSMIAKAAQAPRAATGATEAKGPDMTLNSFDAVMRAMDAELARASGGSVSGPGAGAFGPGSQAAAVSRFEEIGGSEDHDIDDELDAMDEDELAAMDRELRAALKGAGIDDDDDEDGEGFDDFDPEVDPAEARELTGDQKREYKMMRDFLESYKSQAGQSGVVGNLFGRLGQSGGEGK